MCSFSLRLMLGAFLVQSSDCFSTPTASSWQRRLDKALLDIDASPESRFRNFQRALKDPNLLGDVNSAIDAIRKDGFGKGHPELINTLWPEGTIARSDLEGLTALRSQVPEALKELRKQAKTNKSSEKKPFRSKPIDFNALPKPDEIQEELKNALRSTPKGLETPKYSVVRVIDGEVKLGTPEKIEIRKYEAFTVATTPSVGGTGFSTLASYLFGGNEEEESMAMTMPVFVTDRAKDETNSASTSEDRTGTMQFVIPSAMSGTPPAPLANTAVQIEQVPERLVAVKAFPGIVTEDEVVRQKQSLLSALRGAGVVGLDEDEVSVLQYNSPLTIPWRRRNEIAIVVVDEERGDDAKVAVVDEERGDVLEAWKVRVSATSWFDAGVRL